MILCGDWKGNKYEKKEKKGGEKKGRDVKEIAAPLIKPFGKERGKAREVIPMKP